MKNLIFETSAKEILLVKEFMANAIRGTEFEGNTFVAGGAVRDKLMNKEVKDLDLLVTLPDGGIKLAEFLGRKIGKQPVIFKNFGTAQLNFSGVKYKGQVFSNDVDIEFVHPRKESYRGTSRKPETEYGTIEDDASRRDFTINSMYEDLITGEIIDLTGKGMSDLKAGIIRSTGDPDIIFGEDPLRILRGARFWVKYGFKLAPETLQGIKNNAHKIVNISAERIQDELRKILGFPKASEALLMLEETDVLTAIGVTPYKEDIVKINKNGKIYTFYANLALLFGAQFFTEGPDNVKLIMNKLKFEANDFPRVNEIYKAWDNLQYSTSPEVLNRVVSEYKYDIQDLYDFLDANNKGSMLSKVKQNKKLVLPITGDDIMSALGIKPGKEVGQKMQKAKDYMYNNPDATRDELLSYIKDAE